MEAATGTRPSTTSMEPAYVSALAALAGSIIGGMTSAVTTWLNQRAQVKAGQRAAQIEHLEALFDDFIVAASKSYGEALVSSEPKIEEIVKLYAMISRMRVLCSAQTVKTAEKIMSATLDTYFSPNRTVRELHEVIKSGVGIDPLRDFAAAAREELNSVRRHEGLVRDGLLSALDYQAPRPGSVASSSRLARPSSRHPPAGGLRQGQCRAF